MKDQKNMFQRIKLKNNEKLQVVIYKNRLINNWRLKCKKM